MSVEEIVADQLVTVLADPGYPPALPAMRRWLEQEDIENVAITAAFALAHR